MCIAARAREGGGMRIKVHLSLKSPSRLVLAILHLIVQPRGLEKKGGSCSSLSLWDQTKRRAQGGGEKKNKNFGVLKKPEKENRKVCARSADLHGPSEYRFVLFYCSVPAFDCLQSTF